METYDVIIIGAGPGGLRCAEILSKSSLKALVLEQNLQINNKGINFLLMPSVF
ncbi:hypothetical protein TRIP_D120019 [uncultured Paludibacter sp.]|nr:hypothetical protein TRIP_D120019 [uncultured Paludibacter sp.]